MSNEPHFTESPERCQHCKKAGSVLLHTCPYLEELHDDYETKCNCCEDCQHECLMEI